MPPKKQKAQKMNLADFFADTTTGNWADDMDIPSAPAAKDPNAGPRRGEPGYLDSMPDRASREAFSGGPPREELPLPTVPPFTAFIGNLTFETDETELREYFTDLTPTSVRLVKDAGGKAKGFGYVEFPSQDKLKTALERNMSQLGGRTIRVSVAEAPSGRAGAPSAAEESNQWRRAGPLPEREVAPTQARRGNSYNNAGGPGAAPAGEERDWGAARGAKFVAAPAMPARTDFAGIRRDSSGPGRERAPLEPSVADEANQWRSSRPMEEVKRDVGRDVPAQSSPSMADTEATWSRGTKLRSPVVEAPAIAPAAVSSPNEERDWRAARATPTATESAEVPSPAEPPSAPTERRKLNLAPRSVPATPRTSSTETPSSGGGASIFGGAKPIDSAQREKEAEAKLAVREAERKAAASKAKEEEERKVKELADERQRMIREAQVSAAKEFGGPAPPSAAGAGTGGHGQGERGGRGGRGGAANGPGAGSMRGRGGPHRGPGGGERQSSFERNGPKSPTSPRQNNKSFANQQQQQQQRGEDGFSSVARGGRSAPNTSAGAGEKKKEAPKTRQGFSFAAAAMASGGGLLDDDGNGNNDDDEEGDVEKSHGEENGAVSAGDVTEGVKDLKV